MTDQSGFACPEGFIQAGPGEEYCSPCPYGEYAISATECAQAVAGEAYLAPHLRPESCPAGTYSELDGTILDQSKTSC